MSLFLICQLAKKGMKNLWDKSRGIKIIESIYYNSWNIKQEVFINLFL